MNTTKYHASNLGRYAPSEYADVEGYITIHDSPRYGRMTEAELAAMLASAGLRAVRAAAATELAERALGRWQRGGRP